MYKVRNNSSFGRNCDQFSQHDSFFTLSGSSIHLESFTTRYPAFSSVSMSFVFFHGIGFVFKGTVAVKT